MPPTGIAAEDGSTLAVRNAETNDPDYLSIAGKR